MDMERELNRRNLSVFVWILITCALFRRADAVYSAASETAIRSATVLAASYDAISRPVAQTAVSASLNLLAIDDLDMKSQKLTSAGWLTFEWEDPRLTWTPASNDDIEYIFATPSTIWKPELVIDNSLESLGVISDSNLQLRIKYDGKVDWEPPMLFTTFCQVDVTYYPYDQQKCSIEVVGWGYKYSEMTLDHLRSDVNLEDFEQHGEWVIKKSELGISNITETSSDGLTVHVFPQLLFWIYMERRTEFYNLNVMMPILLTSMLMTLVFIVPVDSGEKISYILTILLTLAVFLTITADALPPTSITTSVLGVYLGTVLLLAAIAVLLTVFIIILHHKEGCPSHDSYVVPVSRFAASVTCSNAKSESRPSTAKVRPMSARSGDIDTTSVKTIYPEQSWTEISVVFDKFFFVFFLIISVVVNLIFVLVLVLGGMHTEP